MHRSAYVAVACVHLLYRKERNFAAFVLLLILAKLIWGKGENTIGSVGTAELIGSPVLVEAHLGWGDWNGVVIAMLYILWDYFFEWE